MLGRFALSEVLLGRLGKSSGETIFGEFVATASGHGGAVIVVPHDCHIYIEEFFSLFSSAIITLVWSSFSRWHIGSK